MDRDKRSDTIHIIATVPGAKAFLASGRSFSIDQVYTSHAAVQEYFQFNHGQMPKHLSDLVTYDERRELIAKADRQTMAILESLDRQARPVFEQYAPGPISVVNAFRFHGKLGVWGSLFIERCMVKLAEDQQAGQFIFWDFPDFRLVDPEPALTAIAARNQLTVEFKRDGMSTPTHRPVPSRSSKVGKLADKLHHLFGAFRKKGIKGLRKAWFQTLVGNTRVLNWPIWKRSGKRFLFLGALYDMESVCLEQLKHGPYPLIVHDPMRCLADCADEQENRRLVEELDAAASDIPDDVNPTFYRLIRSKVLEHARQMVAASRFAGHLAQRYDISLAMATNIHWHPVCHAITSFFRNQGKPVVGMQHGGNYLINHSDYHNDSDFVHCTHWISYGGDEGDYGELYPGRTPPCQFARTGSSRLIQNEGGRRKGHWDLLLPLTIATDVINTPCSDPAAIARTQWRLVEWADQLIGKHVLVKLLPGYPLRQCAVREHVHRLQNARLQDAPLSSVLRENTFNAVIIEFNSTPLYDVLPYDIEIFMMEDPLAPLSQTARELLERRAHLAPDVETLIQRYSDWCEDKLPSKRDSSFYTKYVNQRDATRKIAECLISAAKQPHSRHECGCLAYRASERKERVA